jgi:hypothetical protein
MERILFSVAMVIAVVSAVWLMMQPVYETLINTLSTHV